MQSIAFGSHDTVIKNLSFVPNCIQHAKEGSEDAQDAQESEVLPSGSRAQRPTGTTDRMEQTT